MWQLRYQDVLNDFLQAEQYVTTFSPLHVLECLLRLSCRVSTFEQFSQVKVFTMLSSFEQFF